MNVLLLGGESPRHKTWVRELAAALQPQFEQVVYLDYKHWDTPDGTADVPAEVQAVGRLAAPLGEYIIIAKSMGSIIATLAHAKGLVHPTRCLFLGFPLSLVHRRYPDIAEDLRTMPPIRFAQNAHDPLGSFDEVGEYIEHHSLYHASVTQTPGDTHDYPDFEFISQLAYGT